MKKTQFTFDGDTYDKTNEPKRVTMTKAELDKLPIGKFISPARVAEMTGIAESTFSRTMNHPRLHEYRVMASGRRVWFGSKKTVQQFNEAQDDE